MGKSKPWRGRVVAALLVVYLVWGTTYYAMRVALQAYPPFFLSGLRFVGAGTLLLVYSMAVGTFRPSRRLLRDATISGLLLVTLGNGLVVVAEQYVSSGIAAPILSCEAVLILLLSMRYGQRVAPGQAIGMVLCLGGVTLLSLHSQLRYAPVALLGLLLAAVGWALGSVWVNRHARSAHALTLVSLQMLIGGGFSLLLAYGSGERLQLSAALAANAAMLYLLLFGSVTAFLCYNYLIHKVSPSLASSYAYVNPAIAFVVGLEFDHGVWSPSSWLSLLGISSGVWLMIRYEPSNQPSGDHPVL